MGSQGVLTCRDTSSLFNISGDSNTNNPGGNGNGGNNSQRSGSRSRGGNSQHNHRNSVLSNVVPVVIGGSNTGVRASMSKTAREPGEEEDVKDADVKP